MGAYTWLSKEEFERFSKIENDGELNEILQEARSLEPKIFVGTYVFLKPTWNWFKKDEYVTRYTLYSACFDHGEDMEVHVLNLNTSNRDYIANYLFGLINGYRACIANTVNKS